MDTKFQYRLKDNAVYLNCNYNSNNTYAVCYLETSFSTSPAGLLDYACTVKVSELAAPWDTNVKLESQQQHSTPQTSISNCPQEAQVSWLIQIMEKENQMLKLTFLFCLVSLSFNEDKGNTFSKCWDLAREHV